MSAVDKALELGSLYFRNENYMKAKELFIKALQVIKSYSRSDLLKIRESQGLPIIDGTRLLHPKEIKLLDNLAACLDRLGELDKAIKVSDKMIKAEPFNLKCFIRRGRLLMKKGNVREAYENYKRGLENVEEAYKVYKITTPQRFIDLVRSQRDDIKERLMETQILTHKSSSSSNVSRNGKRNYIDPIQEHHEKEMSVKKSKLEEPDKLKVRMKRIDIINKLPIELLPVVLGEFSTKELIALSLVSKSYYYKIFYFPLLFRDFSLRSLTIGQSTKFYQFLKKLQNSCKGKNTLHLKSISFSSKMASDESRILKGLIPQLQNYSCEKLILTVPNSTTEHLTKFFTPNTALPSSIKELSLVLNLRADKRYEAKCLSNFNNLEGLEIIFVSSVVNINHPSVLRPANDITLDSHWSRKLKSIKLICDQKRVNDFPLKQTFLKSSFSGAITQLFITGITFDRETEGLTWLAHFPQVRELWLENNRGGTLRNFFELIKENCIFNSLTKLTFREDIIGPKVQIETSQPSSYAYNLKNVMELDLMGSSITGLALLNMMEYIYSNKLKKLNIGDCPYVQLERLPNGVVDTTLSTSHFFSKYNCLELLTLSQLGSLNDRSMGLLIEQASCFENLRVLDLSLSPSITGVSVYEFVRTLRVVRQRPLDYLNINGCHGISHITANMLKARGLVRNVDCTYEREIWRQFGINSYKYS